MPGEMKSIRGKLYVVQADSKTLSTRFAKDFQEPMKAQ
jgi:hypothetical protein